jgi:hypothetical protein
MLPSIANSLFLFGTCSDRIWYSETWTLTRSLEENQVHRLEETCNTLMDLDEKSTNEADGNQQRTTGIFPKSSDLKKKNHRYFRSDN